MKAKARVKRAPASREKTSTGLQAPTYEMMVSFLDGMTRLVKMLKSKGA